MEPWLGLWAGWALRLEKMAGAGVGAVRRAGHTQIDMRDSEKCVGKSELEAGTSCCLQCDAIRGDEFDAGNNVGGSCTVLF